MWKLWSIVWAISLILIRVSSQGQNCDKYFYYPISFTSQKEFIFNDAYKLCEEKHGTLAKFRSVAQIKELFEEYTDVLKKQCDEAKTRLRCSTNDLPCYFPFQDDQNRKQWSCTPDDNKCRDSIGQFLKCQTCSQRTLDEQVSIINIAVAIKNVNGKTVWSDGTPFDSKLGGFINGRPEKDQCGTLGYRCYTGKQTWERGFCSKLQPRHELLGYACYVSCSQTPQGGTAELEPEVVNASSSKDVTIIAISMGLIISLLIFLAVIKKKKGKQQLKEKYEDSKYYSNQYSSSKKDKDSKYYSDQYSSSKKDNDSKYYSDQYSSSKKDNDSKYYSDQYHSSSLNYSGTYSQKPSTNN